MRRKVRSVSLMVSENFYKKLDIERTKMKSRLGMSNISFPVFTEIISRSNKSIIGGKNAKKR